MIARAFPGSHLDGSTPPVATGNECARAPWAIVSSQRPTPLTLSLTRHAAPNAQQVARDGDAEAVFREAYDDGLRKAKGTVEAIIERYHQAILELEMVRDRMLVDSERDLVDVAVLVAREALGADPAGCAEFTERMVEHALRTLREADSISLRVSPTDYKAVVAKHPELMGEKAVVHISEDASINLGGVVAECSFGRIDATLERRLIEAARRLRIELSAHRQPEVTELAGDRS